MATDAEVTAAGYALPQGQDLITHGDDAILTNAHRSHAIELRAGGVNGQPPVLTAADNIDNYRTTNDYAVYSGSNAPAGWPEPQPGHLRVQQIGNITYQTIRTLNGIWTRTYSVSWFPWVRTANLDDIPDLVLPSSPSGTAGSSRSLRSAPVPLSVSPYTNRVSDLVAVLRLPIHLGPVITRWRVRIANRNDRTNATDGAVHLTGLWVGPGWDGTFTAPTTPVVAGTITLPDDGSDYVSPWTSTPIGGGQQMMLSTGISQGASVHQATGGGWITTGQSTEAHLMAAPPGMTRRATVPLLWTIEAEVSADVPIVAMWGDSITAGTGNTLPVNDAPLSQWARTNGALPITLAYPGTGMVEWENRNRHTWFRADDSAGSLDAIVHFMGQNDLADGQTLAEMKRRYNATIGHLTSLGAPVYLATLTPTNTKAAATNTTRRQYNNWLRTLPDPYDTGMVRDVLDFSAAVSTDDATLTASRTTDGLHLNTAGSTALATAMNARPLVSPSPHSGDTGWRQVTPPALTTGFIRFRRIGKQVTMLWDGAVFGTLSGGTVTITDVIPPGFRCDQWASFTTSGVYGPQRPLRTVAGGNLQIFGLAAGDILRVTATWPTDDPWPLT